MAPEPVERTFMISASLFVTAPDSTRATLENVTLALNAELDARIAELKRDFPDAKISGGTTLSALN